MVITSRCMFLILLATFFLSLAIFNQSRMIDKKIHAWLFSPERENPTEADRKYLKHKEMQSYIVMWTGFIGTSLSGIFMISIMVIMLIARMHGISNDELKSTSFTSVITSIKYSPFESLIKPEDIKRGDIIVYYEFGCKNCEAVYEDLRDKLKDVSDVYWISIQSETGKTLLETYPVTEIPSGVYVQKTGNTPFNKFLLYTVNGDNSVSLNNDLDYGLPKLLYMKSNDL